MFQKHLFLRKNLCLLFIDGAQLSQCTEPLQEHSLLFATEFSGVPDIHFIKIGGMKDCVGLEATQWF